MKNEAVDVMLSSVNFSEPFKLRPSEIPICFIAHLENSLHSRST